MEAKLVSVSRGKIYRDRIEATTIAVNFQWYWFLEMDDMVAAQVRKWCLFFSQQSYPESNKSGGLSKVTSGVWLQCD